MNPFTVRRVIKHSDKKYSVAALSSVCGGRIRHADLIMSAPREVFHCPYAGRVCHFVKGISPSGWIRLWFR